MIAGALEIQLLANLARLQTDMNKAKSVVGDAMGNIQRTVNMAKNALGALGVGLSINYFAKMIQGTINTQDTLAKLSQQLGISVKGLAGLQHAADLSGVSSEGLTKGLKSVSTQLFDADRGLLESKRNFNDLGIGIYTTSGALKSSETVLIEVADQFAAMEDGVNKTALATKLFGRAGLDLIPMLNSGSAAIAQMVAEGQRLNPVTDESAKQAEIYNDNMTRLSKTVSSFGVVLVNDLLPHISELSERMVAFTQSDEFDVWLKRIAVTAQTLATVLGVYLVRSIALSAAAKGSAALATISYEFAVTRLAFQSGVAVGAQYALATAATVASRAMMLIGGPVGLAMIAAGAIFYFAQQGENASERTSRLRKEVDDLADSFGNLSVAQLDQQISQQMTALVALAAQRDALQLPATRGNYGGFGISSSTAKDMAALRQYQEALATLDEALEKGAITAAELAGLRQKAVTAGLAAEQQATDALTEETQKYINELNTKIERVGLSAKATALAIAGDKIAAEASSETRAEILRLVAALYDKEEALKLLTQSQETAIKASQDQAQAVNSVIGALMEEIGALRMSAREKDIHNRLMQAGEMASFNERLAIIALTTALHREEDALNAVGEAAKKAAKDNEVAQGKIAKAAEDAARSIEESYARTHEFMTVSLLDIEESGGNAFDNIAKSFEKMVKRMMAEWAASGLMKLFGMSASPASGITAGVGNGLAGSLFSTITGALLKGVPGSASFVGPVIPGAAAGAGGAAGITGSITGAIGAIPGWGWALIAASAAVAVFNNDDGKKRSNTGFFVGPTPGAQGSDRTFDVAAFESGLKVQGFARRADKDQAIEVIDVFRNVDSAFAAMIKDLNGTLDLTNATLAGLDEEATAGSSGTFLGLGGNGGLGGDITAQIDMFIDQLVNHVSGLEESLLSAIRSAQTSDEVFSLLAAAIKEQTEAEKIANPIRAERNKLQDQYDKLTMTRVELLKRERDALDEVNKAIFDSITAIENLAAAVSAELSLKGALAGARSALRAVGSEVNALHEIALSGAQGVESAQQRINDLNRESADSMRAFAKTIDEFLVTLSPASYGKSLAGLKAQLIDTAGLASGGDKNAQARLLTESQMVIRSAESSSQTRAEFLRQEAFVRTALLSVRDAITPTGQADLIKSPMDVAVEQLNAAKAAQALADAAYASAQALTTNLTFTAQQPLSGLMDALAELGAANVAVTSATSALAAANAAAGIEVTDTATAFRLTTEQALALSAILGLTGTAGTDLISSLEDPAIAALAFADALGALGTDGMAAFLGTLSGEQISNFLTTIGPDQITAFLGVVSPEQVAAFLTAIGPDQIVQFLGSVTTEQIIAFMGVIGADHIAAFMGAIGPENITAFLGSISPQQVAAFLTVVGVDQIVQFLGAITPAQIVSFMGAIGPENITAFFATGNAAMLDQLVGMFAGLDIVIASELRAAFAAAHAAASATVNLNIPVVGRAANDPFVGPDNASTLLGRIQVDGDYSASEIATVMRGYNEGFVSAGNIAKHFGFTVQETLDEISRQNSANIPGFASGGYFGGGLRLVGENGPELEATGPSRIYSNAETKNMMKQDNSELVAELRALRAEFARLQGSSQITANATARMNALLDQIAFGEISLQTRAA